jgi:sterol desaturase/sphingolipid hydroxylase (fatty acid hydroxylase superfamily)
VTALFSTLSSTVGGAFTALHGWVFMTIVEPVLFRFDGAGIMEQAYDGTEFFLLGLVQIAVLFTVLRPLEAWRPAERWVDRRDVAVDVLYTFLHRLGLFSLVMFFVLDPAVDEVAGALRLHGVSGFNLDDLWPGVTSIPIVAFALYLVVLDFANYWIHRGQHRFRWWWALHSLHHSQRQMSLWSDDRNHLVDDLLRDAIFAAIAVVIGVQPGQFVLLLIATRSLESLQHANLRLTFGRWGGRLVVSPRFHRRHHAIGDGHEGEYRGCNFAVLFPVWDVLFGSANFDEGYPATGIRDQLAGRDYGRGFWQQQWFGLKRMLGG